MKIGIIGLGLIGGSMARAFHNRTGHTVYGVDMVKSVTLGAKMIGAIHEELTDERIPSCDFIFVCLYPKDTVEYIKRIAPLINKDAIVSDTCGVKKQVCDGVQPIAKQYGFTFIGAHPMAGGTGGGFSASKDTLFVKTPMLLTPYTGTPIAVVDRLRRLLSEIGIARTPVFTPEEHDDRIAYTSQLTHVLASAYVRTPRSVECGGCTGGSFRDATRVAKLNADMWTELCMENRAALIQEIEGLTARLNEYSTALKQADEKAFAALLEEGAAFKTQADAARGVS
ncbi:MAG: prephenate dehydrogenase [Eubacteriales bacterium]|nr:prephenate dehydrogenase [Eubacteriales bacterium]